MKYVTQKVLSSAAVICLTEVIADLKRKTNSEEQFDKWARLLQFGERPYFSQLYRFFNLFDLISCLEHTNMDANE